MLKEVFPFRFILISYIVLFQMFRVINEYGINELAETHRMVDSDVLKLRQKSLN